MSKDKELEQLNEFCRYVFGRYREEHARADAALSLLEADESFSLKELERRVKLFRADHDAALHSVVATSGDVEPAATIRLMLEVLESRKKLVF